jgi:hypothetical protein|tara:strand:+ start:293 stop:433 length:141 start_codon:yes stop_codon:yes gene_type:complete
MNIERLENERELMSLYITNGDETKMQMMSEWLDVCNKIGRLKDGQE